MARKSPPTVDISEMKDKPKAIATAAVFRIVAGSMMDFVQMLEK
jgi:hypothetical protein